MNAYSSNNHHSHSGCNVFGRLFWSCKTIEQKERYIAEKLARKDERRFIPHSSIGKAIAAIPLALAFIVVGLLTVILGVLTLGRFNLLSAVFRKNTQALKGKDLSNIDFSKDSLKDLKDMNLDNAKFDYATLAGSRGPYLSRASLKGAQLQWAKLSHHKEHAFSGGMPRALSGANLSGQNLQKIELGAHHAASYTYDCSRSILANTNFSQANLYNISFSHANASGARFDDLHSSTNVDFSYANLQNATFGWHYNDKPSIDFSYADLRGATLTEANLRAMRFNHAILDDNTNISLRELELDSDYGIDLALNHLNNEGTSVLTAIHSIPAQYKNHRIALMEQVIQQILNSDNIDDVVSLAGEALIDILTRQDSPYLESNKIAQFFNQHLLPRLIAKANHTVVELNEPLLAFLLKLGLESCQPNNNREDALRLDPIKDNACLNQILFLARNSGNQALQQQADELFAAYIKWLSSNNKSLAQCFTKQYIEDILMIDTDNDADDDEKKDLLKANQSSYVFIAKDVDNVKEPSSCIIVNDTFYQEKLAANQPVDEASTSWSNDLYLFESGDNGYKNQPNWAIDTLTKYPLLYGSYQRESHKNMFPAFIQSLGLGQYEQAFLDATKKTREEAINFVSQNDKDALSNLFKDKYQKADNKQGYDKLSERYLEELGKIFDFNNKTKKQQAIVLLCLAAVFARYSSSKMFGTEGDSPDALRAFALALLNQAVDYDSTIIDKDQLNLWRDQLTGSNGKFTCTAILSGSMIRFIKNQLDPDYTNTLAWLLPPKWV